MSALLQRDPIAGTSASLSRGKWDGKDFLLSQFREANKQLLARTGSTPERLSPHPDSRKIQTERPNKMSKNIAFNPEDQNPENGKKRSPRMLVSWSALKRHRLGMRSIRTTPCGLAAGPARSTPI